MLANLEDEDARRMNPFGRSGFILYVADFCGRLAQFQECEMDACERSDENLSGRVNACADHASNTPQRRRLGELGRDL